jgi:nitrate reductase gamma subunit
MIAILAVWRYGFRRLPLTYDPQYWGAVFPLGMYAVVTFRMADAMSLGFLDFIPLLLFWTALVAWAFWAAFPFTRLVHAWSIPLQYLGRPYIIYRRRFQAVR